jgi:hypothetical protein
MPSIWGSGILNDATISIQLQAILLTYDILKDDEEEIRDIGASIATNILACGLRKSGAPEMVPLVAGQKIAGYLAKNYRNSPDLCRRAIERMTGSRLFGLESDSSHSSSVDRLNGAAKEDTALFVVEKQNLFVDDVREAILWSQVLKKMSTTSIANNTVVFFTEWATDGLDLLIQKMEEEDGALGWCSKQDVFIVFMQILCAADVLLTWRLKTKKMKIRGSEVRGALMRLLKAGLRNGLHEMLVAKIENIIMESATSRIIKLGNSLTVVERNAVEAGRP